MVKLQLENAGGDGIGDEVQFPVGTGGGGGGSGTIVTAAFQQSPMYGNAGGSFIIRAAVRSVTTVGSSEQENTIATIALYDRDTNTLLDTFLFNKASSVSLSTYDFVMDVSQYFAAAGVRRFRCLITDDGGNTGSRNINVTAVDVTVSSVQTLQYTQSTALAVGGVPRASPCISLRTMRVTEASRPSLRYILTAAGSSLAAVSYQTPIRTASPLTRRTALAQYCHMVPIPSAFMAWTWHRVLWVTTCTQASS